MKNLLEGIQHIGITVSQHKRSRRFYHSTLGLALLAETVSRGEKLSRMYRLEEPVNRITWYQIGDSGIETFYLPRHPSGTAGAGNILSPGYRYMAFWVDGFDDFTGRIEREDFVLDRFDARTGRCARLLDPDGIQVILCDSGNETRVGYISGIKEVGLTVSDMEEYDKFFEAIGLWKTEDDTDIPGILWKFECPSPLYGHIRLMNPPGVISTIGARCFPAASQIEPIHKFCDAGIRHAAYYVEDIDSFYRHGLENGICFLFEPVKVSGGSKITYFLDPEGNTVEAMEVQYVPRIAARFAGRLRRIQIDSFKIASTLFK